MIVNLGEEEVTICHVIGRMRNLIARSAKIPNTKMGDQPGSESDVLGFAAEYAFAKHFNIFTDLGLKPRSGSADGRLNGSAYDVKATHHKNGRLLCTLKDNPDVDIFVLGIVTLPEVNFVGWAWTHELRQEKNLIDLGHGQGYGLTQDQLRKFKCDQEGE